MLILCFAAIPAIAQGGLSKRTHELFEWFDQLGFEDTSKSKFILIRTGASVMTNGTRREDDASAGFLLEDSGPTFRAVLADLTICLCTKAGRDESDADYCGYRELSIEKEGQRLLRELRDADYFKRWEDDSHFRYHDRLERHSQIFVLTRACAQRGHDKLAESLARALQNHPSHYGLSPYYSLWDGVKQQLERTAAWSFRLSLRDPEEQWETLRARAAELNMAFPGKGYDEFAARFATLAREEAEHRPVAPKSLDALVPREKARELVWHLRDEQDEALDNGDYWPRPWPFEPRKSNGAMAGLRELGLEAVPALIEELRNPRMSRSVFRNNRYGGGVMLRETNELAVSVLNDIAGVNFYWLGHWEKPEERWEKVSAAIDDWWQAVQTKGEKAWLIEAVRDGGRRACYCAERLFTKYPDDFLEPALAGLAASTNSPDVYPRDQLLERLTKRCEARVEDFLIRQLESADDTSDRVAFAYVLRKWGRAEADAAIRTDWKRIVAEQFKRLNSASDSIGLPSGPVSSAAFSSDPVGSALAFLARSDSVESLRELLAAWPKMPTNLRNDLVETFARRDFTEETETTERAGPATRALIREVLLNALDDTTEFMGTTLGFENGTVVDPRLCDLAADALQEHWPHDFQFDRFAPESTRERQRIALLNIHRSELGLAEVPMPLKRPKVLPANENYVTAVEWEPGSAKPKVSDGKKFAAWKSGRFDTSALISALINYAKTPQRGTSSFRITVGRDGDSTGIVVRLRLVPGDSVKDAGRNTREMILANRDVLHSSGGAGSSDYKTKSRDWADFLRHANTVVALPVNQPFVIKAEVSLSE